MRADREVIRAAVSKAGRYGGRTCQYSRYLSRFVGIVLLQALDRPVLGNPDVTILAASLGPLLVPLFWFSCPARRHNTSLSKTIKTPKCDGLHLSLSGWPCIGLCHSRVAGRRRHSGGCPILLFHGREVSEFHTHIRIQLWFYHYSFLRHPCPARIWPRFVGNVGNVVFVQLVAESAAHWCLVNSNSADKLRRKAVCNGQAAVAENPLALQYASDRWRCDKVGTCWHLVQPV